MNRWRRVETRAVGSGSTEGPAGRTGRDADGTGGSGVAVARTPLTAGLAGWRVRPAVRVGAPEAEAEVEVRVDMNLDDVLVIGPECVLRVYDAVHSTPSCAAPSTMRRRAKRPAQRLRSTRALQRTASPSRGCGIRA